MSNPTSESRSRARPPRLIASIRKNSREEIRFSLSTYKGIRKIDVRIYETDKHGVMRRQDKGLAIAPHLARQVGEAYYLALVAAVEEGLLDEGEPG